MKAPIVRQHDKSLEYVVYFPPAYVSGTGLWPVLCFLHGRGEGAESRDHKPQHIREALTLHGPLRPGSSPQATDHFIVVAPQLPQSEVYEWDRNADAVREIVKEVWKDYSGDSQRTYLTGFSWGGDGVFDIALAQHGFWAALWAVDPTRVPNSNPRCPVCLSLGSASRGSVTGFIGVFQSAANNFIYCDRGANHVDTAILAYQDDQIYDWLLTKSV